MRVRKSKSSAKQSSCPVFRPALTLAASPYATIVVDENGKPWVVNPGEGTIAPVKIGKASPNEG